MVWSCVAVRSDSWKAKCSVLRVRFVFSNRDLIDRDFHRGDVNRPCFVEAFAATIIPNPKPYPLLSVIL